MHFTSDSFDVLGRNDIRLVGRAESVGGLTRSWPARKRVCASQVLRAALEERRLLTMPRGVFCIAIPWPHELPVSNCPGNASILQGSEDIAALLSEGGDTRCCFRGPRRFVHQKYRCTRATVRRHQARVVGKLPVDPWARRYVHVAPLGVCRSGLQRPLAPRHRPAGGRSSYSCVPDTSPELRLDCAAPSMRAAP